MANRYWVGGTATWDGTAGTKWSTTSGGAGGAAVPTAADDVFLNAASGSVTVTLSSGNVCRSLNCTGFTGTLSHPASTTLTIGDGTAGASNVALLLVSGMTYAPASATKTFTFVSTSATAQTIDSGGKSIGGLIFNGSGGSWSFNANFQGVIGSTITHTAGTVNINGKTVTVGFYTSTGSGTRVLTMGAGTLSTNWSGTSTFTVTDTGGSSTYTFNANTGTLSFASTGPTVSLFGSGTFTVYNATYTGNGVKYANQGTSPLTVSNALTILAGTPSAAESFIIDSTLTVNGSFVPKGGGWTTRLLIKSGTPGTAVSVVLGGSATFKTAGYEYIDMMDLTGSGGATNERVLTGTNTATGSPTFAKGLVGDCGGNSGFTLASSSTTATLTDPGVGNTVAWSDYTQWSNSRPPLPQDDVTTSFALATLTLDMPRMCRKWTQAGAVIPSPSIGSSTDFYLFGGWVGDGSLAQGTTSGYTLNFMGRGTHTLNQPADWGGGYNFESYGGSYTCAAGIGCIDNLTWTSGTFASAGYGIYAYAFLCGSGTKTLSFSTSTFTVRNVGVTGAVWSMSSANTTISTNTHTVVLSSTGTSGGTVVRSIVSSAQYIGSIVMTDSLTDNLTITGNAIINNLTIQDSGAAKTVTFTAAGTITIQGTVTMNGYASKLLSIVSSSAGSAATLNKTSGNSVYCDYMSLKDSTPTALTGCGWYAGRNSTSVSNNAGWIFTSHPYNLGTLGTG